MHSSSETANLATSNWPYPSNKVNIYDWIFITCSTNKKKDNGEKFDAHISLWYGRVKGLAWKLIIILKYNVWIFLHCQWKFYGRRDWKMFLLFILLFILFRFTGIFMKFMIVKYVAIMRKNTSWDIEFFSPYCGGKSVFLPWHYFVNKGYQSPSYFSVCGKQHLFLIVMLSQEKSFFLYC